jgi:lysophospholipase L1-like esterase
VRKTILCFGDSNTWGFDPATKQRLPEDVRWTGVLQRELGPRYNVIEEGLNGRTTVWDDPIEEGRSGKLYLAPCLLSHQPIHLVVLMLGTNDLKKRYSISPFDLGRSIGLLLNMISRSPTGPAGASPKILLMSPPHVGDLGEFAEMFEGAGEKSKGVAHYYLQQAQLYGCDFLDAATVVVPSRHDGVHLDPAEHAKLGVAVANMVQQAVLEEPLRQAV